MAVVSFLAKRSLLAGISVDDTVVLDLQLRALTPSRSVDATQHKAMDGTRETNWIMGEKSWAAAVRPLLAADVAAMEQFLDSVESGQVFSFAPYNASTDSPIDYRNVVLEPSGYTWNREVQVGGGGASDLFSTGFRMIEVP